MAAHTNRLTWIEKLAAITLLACSMVPAVASATITLAVLAAAVIVLAAMKVLS